MNGKFKSIGIVIGRAPGDWHTLLSWKTCEEMSFPNLNSWNLYGQGVSDHAQQGASLAFISVTPTRWTEICVSHADNHGCYEFRSTKAVPCPEDLDSQQALPSLWINILAFWHTEKHISLWCICGWSICKRAGWGSGTFPRLLHAHGLFSSLGFQIQGYERWVGMCA